MTIGEQNLRERLRTIVPMGGAICLLGAGYSIAATDQRDRPLPGSDDLIREIKREVGISESDYASLADIAGYCEDDSDRERALRRLLIGRLTLCNPADNQKIVALQPWRSIFTTNFDDVIERSLGEELISTMSSNAVLVRKSARLSRPPLPQAFMYPAGRALLHAWPRKGSGRDRRRPALRHLRAQLP